MSDEQIPFRPNRSFTKRMLILNNIAAWCAIFGSLYLGQAVAVVAATVIWTLAIQSLAYAAFLYANKIHAEIVRLQADRVVLSYQFDDAWREFSARKSSVERLTGATYKPLPLPGPEGK